MRQRKCPRGSAQSETPGMHGNSTRENRETPATPAGDAAGRLEKALSQKSNMHVDGESDGRRVPAKCPNNGVQAPAEGMEGRRPTKENIGQATPPRTQSRTSELSDLRGVREVVSRQSSEVGAVCSSSARTDLCGGRRVNRRPYRDKGLRAGVRCRAAIAPCIKACPERSRRDGFLPQSSPPDPGEIGEREQAAETFPRPASCVSGDRRPSAVRSANAKKFRGATERGAPDHPPG